MSEANRYIQFVCPLCLDRSPVCDQKEDTRRTKPAEWYQHHLATQHGHPAPTIVRAELFEGRERVTPDES